jgi:prepilin-type N-terminal cleavage/methylation domain-containing protein
VRFSSGYTLLEMVVVLAIIGLIMSIAAPPMFKTVERWRERAALEDIQRQLQRLPVLVKRSGKAQTLNSDRPWPAELPPLALEGWQLHFSGPLVVQANGFCEGAELELRQGERRVPFRVTAPFCQIAADATDAPQ